MRCVEPWFEQGKRCCCAVSRRREAALPDRDTTRGGGRRALFEDSHGAVYLFSALDGRMLRVPLPPAAGGLVAALWDGADCNCAALVLGRPAPPSAASLSVHTLVYMPVGLDGPGAPGRRPIRARLTKLMALCLCLVARARAWRAMQALEALPWTAAFLGAWQRRTFA